MRRFLALALLEGECITFPISPPADLAPAPDMSPAPTGHNVQFALQQIDVGGSPISVASGDLDMDGAQDLIVADGNNKAVTVFFGDGQGAFRKGPVWATARRPVALLVRNVDRDPGLDIVVLEGDLAMQNPPPSVVEVSYNPGKNLPGKVVQYPVGRRAVALVAADLDSDTLTDILVTNQMDDTLSVLYGQAKGDFRQQTVLPCCHSPRSVAVADIDKNGIQDLAIACAMDTDLQIFGGMKNGGFGLPMSFFVPLMTPRTVAIADFDQDGREDVAIGGEYGPGGSQDLGAVLMRGASPGGLKPGTTYGEGDEAASVLATDLDLDGYPDLVVLQALGGWPATVGFLFGNADGTLDYPMDHLELGRGGDSMNIGDLDGNGRMDIVVPNTFDGTLSLMYNHADSNFGR